MSGFDRTNPRFAILTSDSIRVQSVLSRTHVCHGDLLSRKPYHKDRLEVLHAVTTALIQNTEHERKRHSHCVDIRITKYILAYPGFIRYR